MSTVSSIEWTERTWNPVAGCNKVSQGCKNCYAEVMARRLHAMGAAGYERPFTVVRELPQRLEDPLKIKRSSLWFVNSMSDLFQPEVSDRFIAQVFDTIERAHWHTFQILTKRPERMVDYFKGNPPPPPNAWLGVSVENRKQGLPRIPLLRKVPATVRFLSIEPLLEDLGRFDLSGIHWVIVGGESGHRARAMHPDWARNIRNQCEAASVPYFFKQWGAHNADGDRVGKHEAGRQLDGRTYDQMPLPAV